MVPLLPARGLPPTSPSDRPHAVYTFHSAVDRSAGDKFCHGGRSGLLHRSSPDLAGSLFHRHELRGSGAQSFSEITPGGDRGRTRAGMVNRDIIAGICFNARKHLFERKIEPRSVLRVETNRHPVMGHVRPARWQGYFSAHGVKPEHDDAGQPTSKMRTAGRAWI